MSGQITALNVAEKNSVAREVTRLLCHGNRAQDMPSCATYCKNFRFPFVLQGTQMDMIFSSVAGHLLELDFIPPYNSWRGCEPQFLYEAGVEKKVSKGEGEKIRRNLQNLARRAHWLILWLDCDREGENIAFEVISVCREVNPRLVVKRARFSALIARDIFRAVNNLVEPNANESAAVDARQEIDLRIGSSFTRLQTLLLQDKFNWTRLLPPGRDRMLLSYGPCQFPTLGLIVQREWEIQSHVYENFWSIDVHYQSPNEGTSAGKCIFKWERGNIFDKDVVELYHRMCMAHPEATVVDVSGAQRRRNAPVPLCTLELQKRGSQSLRMSGERIMKMAEELYQGGFISYPRTETTVYADGYDLRGMVQAQADAQFPWSGFAHRLLERDFRWPASGGQDDKAHPPIHPTRPYTEQGAEGKRQVYEFIARHFLASCAPDAIGQETKILIDISGEQFKCTGLMVVEKNWLEVFPWISWGGNDALPRFDRNQRFLPESIRLHEGTTQPPPRMKESDLLSKMDEYGIGTDATVADHIAKQLERGYAVKDNATMAFAPTHLGEALISAYRKMGLENLWLPTLRGIIEGNIDSVARGRRTKEEVLQEAIQAFKRDFASASARSNILENEVRLIVFGPNNNAQDVLDVVDGQPFAKCVCGANLVLVNSTADHGPSIACAIMHAGEKSRKELPQRVTRSVEISNQTCHACGPDSKKLKFSFDVGLLPPGYRHMSHCTRCVKCDEELSRLLRTIGPTRNRRRTDVSGRRGEEGPRGGGRGPRGRAVRRQDNRQRQAARGSRGRTNRGRGRGNADNRNRY